MASTSSNSTPAAQSTEDIRLKPWKYLGYEAYSSFVSSHDDFFIFRRFSALTSRVILSIQDEISELEERRTELEKELRQPNGVEVHNGTFRGDRDTQNERSSLVLQIRRKLKEYHELILQHSELRAKPKASRESIESLRNWHYNNETAIHAPEIEYIDHVSDLAALNAKVHSPLRVWLERSQRFRLLGLWRKDPPKRTPGDHLNFTDGEIHYASEKRIEAFVTVVIIAVGLSMLIAPLWALAYATRRPVRLGIITAFVTLFVTLLSCTTLVKTFECLAATAAYAAVLVVFLQSEASSA